MTSFRKSWRPFWKWPKTEWPTIFPIQVLDKEPSCQSWCLSHQVKYFTNYPLHYQRRAGIPLTGLISPHFCACPKPGPGFPTPYFVVLFVFYDLRREVVATFLYACAKPVSGFQKPYVQWSEVRGDCSFYLYWWNL